MILQKTSHSNHCHDPPASYATSCLFNWWKKMTHKTQSHQITKTSFMKRQRCIFSQMCPEKGKIPIQKCMCLFNHEMKNKNDSEEKRIGYFYNRNTKNVNQNQVKTFPTLPPYNRTSHSIVFTLQYSAVESIAKAYYAFAKLL